MMNFYPPSPMSDNLSSPMRVSETTYALLYKEYVKKLYNYGKKFTEDSNLIQDSIQEVFLDFWVKQEKLLKAENLPAYFFSSFRYVLLKNLKQAGKKVGTEDAATGLHFSVEHFLIEKETESEQRDKVRRALQSLTSRQREAVFLRFYEGLSYDEVAAVLHITKKAAYKIVARSLDALKNLLLSVLVLLLFCLPRPS